MRLKQTPEDFLVEEKIKLNVKKSGDYTYFWLTKKNWTTVRAIKEIAKSCGVSFKRFKFAGNKDKQAITKQAVSSYKIAPEVLQNVKLKDIRIEIIGFGDEPINLGTLKGNKFEIIIRDLQKKDFKRITKNYKLISKKGFPNYFGEQRFGAGNTALIGKEIVKGNFKQAVKYLLTYSEDENKVTKKARKFANKNFGEWNLILQNWPKFLGLEKAVLNYLIQFPNDFAGALRKVPKPIRKMYVHAYQSYLWNKGIEVVLKSAVNTSSGSFCYPLVGYKTKLGNDKCRKFRKDFLSPRKCTTFSLFSKTIKELLEKDNLTLENFGCARMPELASEGAERPAIVKPKKLKLAGLEKDDLNKGKFKIKLSFGLPKGSYATELIRQITM